MGLTDLRERLVSLERPPSRASAPEMQMGLAKNSSCKDANDVGMGLQDQEEDAFGDDEDEGPAVKCRIRKKKSKDPIFSDPQFQAGIKDLQVRRSSRSTIVLILIVHRRVSGCTCSFSATSPPLRS